MEAEAKLVPGWRALVETVLLTATLLGGNPAAAQPAAARPAWLADRHAAQGICCASCHGEAKPGDVATSTCLSCHVSYQELARKTANRLRNPHDSHYPDMECTTCHHGHRKDEDFCAGCHGPD